MKQITLDSGEYLLVEVPDDASDISINIGLLGDMYLAFHYGMGIDREYLPPGNWVIIGRGDELTEEQWFDIVYDSNTVASFKNFKTNQYSCYSPDKSGHSLIDSYGMKPQGTLILKKQ